MTIPPIASAGGAPCTGHRHGQELDAPTRARLGRRAQLLAAASVTYNAVEAVIAITAGVVAGSVALVGFGLDSVVEVSSGLIILWQFSHRMPETRERRALRAMAASFFALAGYVTFESARALTGGHTPDASTVGIGLAFASLVVMPFLSWAQRRTGRALGSNAVVADSTQTLLCTYLSAVLLAGLVLNATLGWSWADPVAGLVIAAIAAKEGREAWRGEGCCAPSTRRAPQGEHDTDACCTEAGACKDDCCSTPVGDAADRAGVRLLDLTSITPGRRATLPRRGRGRTGPTSDHRRRRSPEPSSVLRGEHADAGHAVRRGCAERPFGDEPLFVVAHDVISKPARSPRSTRPVGLLRRCRLPTARRRR